MGNCRAITKIKHALSADGQNHPGDNVSRKFHVQSNISKLYFIHAASLWAGPRPPSALSMRSGDRSLTVGGA